MIFVIFTEEGLLHAEADVLTEKASLWLNPSLVEQSDLSRFHSAGISIHTLPEQIEAINEKSVSAALSYVEQNSPKTEIFVEYL